MADVTVANAHAASSVAAKSSWTSSIYDKVPLLTECFSIRVLDILPGQAYKPMRCKLRTTKVNACTSYEALSYTWGELKGSKAITVNGNEFLVTTNLESALYRLRRPDKRRRIWVDAVCINQDDVEERGIYVRGMGYIYRNAEQVIIWLGTGTPSTTAAILHAKNELALPVPQQPDDSLWPTNRIYIEQKRKYAEQQQLQELIVNGMPELMSHPWFTRVWIVQELCLAAGDPVLVCGAASIAWSSFIARVTEISEIMAGPSRRRYILDLNDMRQRARAPPRLRDFTITIDRASLIEDDLWWLRHTATFQATDPRDKLYALLGLTRGPLASQIPVDYTVEPHALMKKLMLTQIDSHQNSDLLALCDIAAVRTSRQSWVPDLTQPGQPPLSPIRSVPEKWGPIDRPWKAWFSIRAMSIGEYEAGSRAGVLCRVDENKRLEAKGHKLGSITSIVDGSSAAVQSAEEIDQSAQPMNAGATSIRLILGLHRSKATRIKTRTLRYCERSLHAVGCQPLSFENWTFDLSALKRHITRLGRMRERGIEAGITQAALERYIMFVTGVAACIEACIHWGPLLAQLTGGGRTEEYQEWSASVYNFSFEVRGDHLELISPLIEEALLSIRSRAVFFTNTGLVGLGPPLLKPSDGIVMFLASAFAYAIRNGDAGPTLVGQVMVYPPAYQPEYQLGSSMKPPGARSLSRFCPAEDTFLLN